MNNSFARLIDGMCATLRKEALARLDDDFARGQVIGVVSLLNTFKVRADWSAGFLVQEIAAQRKVFDELGSMLEGLPALPSRPVPPVTPVAELLAARDEGNRAIGETLRWLDEHPPAPEVAARAEQLLREAMRAEIDIEMKNLPRQLFAEMSSGRED